MKRIKKNKKIKYIFGGTACFLALLIMRSFSWVQREWSDVDFATIIFQIRTPLKGTNKDVVSSYVRYCVPKALLAAVCISFLCWFLRNMGSQPLHFVVRGCC